MIAGKSTFGKSNYANECAYSYNRVLIVDPLKEYDGKYLWSVSAIERHITNNPIYRVKTNNVLALERICGILLEQAAPNNRITLLLEEITRLDLDPKLKRFPAFRDIVFGGGHEGIDIIAVAQNFSSFPKPLRSQWIKITLFCQTEKSDLERIWQISQDPAILEIPKLAPREYVQITNQKIERGRS